MSAVALNPALSFSDRAQVLLERLDYRRANTPEEREPIYRLRYEAYLREGAISPQFVKRFADDYDEAPNCWIYGVHLDGRLVSSFRLHVASHPTETLPGTRVFSDVLLPELSAGKVIIDPTRFVTDHVAARTHPELAYLTVRLGWLAGESFNADLILATVRAEHQAFYKRVFGHQPMCPPREYPSLQKPISLMTLDYRNMKERVHQRYPFMRSTFFERRMLFERPALAAQAAA
jgi:hypothetical protein